MTIRGFNDRQNLNGTAGSANTAAGANRADRNERADGGKPVAGSASVNNAASASASTNTARTADTASIQSKAGADDDRSIARGELKKMNARSFENLNRVNQKIREGEYDRPEVVRETTERMLEDIAGKATLI